MIIASRHLSSSFLPGLALCATQGRIAGKITVVQQATPLCHTLWQSLGADNNGFFSPVFFHVLANPSACQALPTDARQSNTAIFAPFVKT
jgi:hypothetical protein